MPESEFTLKATPPRMPRIVVERARLQQVWGDVHDRAALLVVAPAGFGKTTAIMHWRQRWLESDALVAWLSADAEDDPARFATAVLQSVLRAAGRPADERRLPRDATGVETLTALLSYVVSHRVQTVIMVDDAGRLPEATVRGPLQYLLLNAPPNLHVVISSRVRLPLQLAELVAKDHCAMLGTDDLRMRLEESIEVIGRRLGARVDLDQCARLHELTEGWAIGLQLAMATIQGEPDLDAAIRSLSARRGSLQEYFVGSLLSRLSPAMADALMRIAILDRFDAALFQALTGSADPEGELDRMVRETPLMVAGERGSWYRLHPLARDFLLGQFERLPAAEQADLHVRAARWFAAHQRFHEAAEHALAAGDEAQAQDHAARSLWALSTGGKLAEAREWLDRLPRDMLAKDPELRLVAASILALSDRNAEALAIARELLAEPSTPPETAVVALRVAAGAAAFGDRLGLIPELLPRWPLQGEPGDAPLYTLTGLNSRAIVALHAGATAQVRELVARQEAHGSRGLLRLAAALGRMLIGLSHLWDGEPVQAEAALRPGLAEAETEDRRGIIACLYASVVAAALVERDQPAAAQAMLANRLDVIERYGFPDNLLCAYRALTQAALAQGDERRALSVLHSLEALAERRRLPRLRAYALAEQVRIHAVRGWTDTTGRLVQALDALAAEFSTDELRPLQPEFRLAVALAKVHVALARRELDEAERHLDAAGGLATDLRRVPELRQVQVLRAVVAQRRGSAQAMSLLKEAHDLAALSGQARLVRDTHPLALEMLAELQVTADDSSAATAGAAAQDPTAERTPSAELLTTKETAILGLLGKGMPNKLIARSLDVSGETVKWHLKNVYLKLSVGSRRHAVERARLLGLLQ